MLKFFKLYISAFPVLPLVVFLSCSSTVAASEVCVTIDDGSVVCGTPQNSPQSPNNQINQKEEFEEGFLSLESCKRSSTENSTVKCNFLITSKKDVYLIFMCGRDVKFFDNYGREYFSSSSQIGQSTSSSTCANIPGSQMLNGVTLQGSLTFEEIPAEVKDIVAMKILIGQNFHSLHSFVFRNIPITAD
jgi:hypothetical protein